MKPLCVVSGGTSGIGRSIAKSLADRYRLVLIYRSNHQRAQETLKQFENSSDVIAISGDLSDLKEATRVVEEIKKWDSRSVDLLVHCAGQSLVSFFVIDTIESLLSNFDQNFKSAFILTNLLLKDMYRANQGKIIFVSSLSAVQDRKSLLVYSTAKAAMESFAKGLAAEVYRRGIRINCIRPGLVRTEMTEALLNAAPILEDQVNPISAVLNAVEYLINPASSGVSGTIVQVNGANPSKGTGSPL